MTDLFERVLHHIEGNETEMQNWETKTAIESYALLSFGPDRWIERAALGRLMAIDLLAVILFSVRDAFGLEQERRIVESWATELRKALSAGEIQARDAVTLLALDTLPDGWEWLVSFDDADKFIAARGMGWAPSEQVAFLLEQSRKEGIRYLDPKTGQLLKHDWLAGYEPNQPAPEQSPATPAPVETVEQRRARYLAWHTDEHRINPRGALQRVYEREAKQNTKADRANIGKDIEKARGTAKTQKQAGGMFGQLVQVRDGKRLN